MSASLNRAQLLGRLGNEPEVRYTAAGKAVANFTLATDESYTNAQGERQKITEWHRVVAWDKRAEVVQQYVHKGDLVYIEGKITSRKWTDKEGIERSVTEINALNVQLLGSRTATAAPAAGNTQSRPPAQRQAAPAQRQTARPATRPAPAQPEPEYTPNVEDSDIPF
jgi:single-strand DNA-binding protein